MWSLEVTQRHRVTQRDAETYMCGLLKSHRDTQRRDTHRDAQRDTRTDTHGDTQTYVWGGLLKSFSDSRCLSLSHERPRSQLAITERQRHAGTRRDTQRHIETHRDAHTDTPAERDIRSPDTDPAEQSLIQERPYVSVS